MSPPVKNIRRTNFLWAPSVLHAMLTRTHGQLVAFHRWPWVSYLSRGSSSVFSLPCDFVRSVHHFACPTVFLWVLTPVVLFCILASRLLGCLSTIGHSPRIPNGELPLKRYMLHDLSQKNKISLGGRNADMRRIALKGSSTSAR